VKAAALLPMVLLVLGGCAHAPVKTVGTGPVGARCQRPQLADASGQCRSSESGKAEDPGLTVRTGVAGSTMIVEAWARCPRCYWVADEMIVDHGKSTPYFHSSALGPGRMTSTGSLDADGHGRLELGASGTGPPMFVFFNLKLCTAFEASTCRPASDAVLVFDLGQGTVRQYRDLEAFADAEDEPFRCAIDDGVARCRYPHQRATWLDGR